MWCAACGLEVEESAGPCVHCAGEVLLDGRYILKRVLGEGSVGVTYLAQEGASGPLVAIKELSMRRLKSFKKQELFEREAHILKQLDHHGVPHYIEDFIWGMGKHQAFYIVEEYVRGETLRQALEHERYGEQDVFDWLSSALSVLDYLHSRSPMVVHRDVKPENLMRRESGQVVLVDFGVVRDGAGEGTLVGTPGYMAPEQLMGEAYPESDVYALGMVACEMLTREDVSMLRGGRWCDALERVCTSTPMRRFLEGVLREDYRERLNSKQALEVLEQIRRGEEITALVQQEHAMVARTQGDEQGLVRRRSESLFGMWSAIGAVAVMGLPCATITVGFLNALILLSVVCLVMILLVPFISFGEEEVSEEG